MKKLLVAAMAVGTIAVGGVARADVIDSVGNAISNLFGVPYDPSPNGAVPGSIYRGSDGHQYQVDAAGRSIRIDQYGSYRDAWGRTVYLGADSRPLYMEQNGTLVPYRSGGYAMGAPYDRYPDDPRYR